MIARPDTEKQSAIPDVSHLVTLVVHLVTEHLAQAWPTAMVVAFAAALQRHGGAV